MNLEQARRLRDNEDYRAFIEVLKEDEEALKEDMLREDVDPHSYKTAALTIRRVRARLENLIEDLEEDEEESAR